MKSHRQAEILRLIQTQEIETQEQMLEQLRVGISLLRLELPEETKRGCQGQRGLGVGGVVGLHRLVALHITTASVGREGTRAVKTDGGEFLLGGCHPIALMRRNERKRKSQQGRSSRTQSAS